MDFDEYQRLAMRTSPDDHDRVENGILGMIGEGGEVVDLIKKWKFQSGENAPFPREEMIEELGDCLWYVAEIATGMGMKLGEIDYNISKQGKTEHSKEEEFNVLYIIRFVESAAQAGLWYDPYEVSYFIECAFRSITDCILNFGFDIQEVMWKNIEKLKKRYPDGFDPDRSINREKYEKADAEQFENVNRCISCGAVIPEGRWMCPACEKREGK